MHEIENRMITRCNRGVTLTYLWWIFFLLIIILNNKAFADDPGITKVRLIQETDTSYILEIDVSQSLLWTIKAPIFPERFHVSKPDYENQSGWVTIKVRITTNEEPLSNRDEILLPWIRNGVDITAQWKDGKTYKGLFNRTLNGIHIPMKDIMPVQKTTGEVLQESFLMGAHHLLFMFIHLLLIIVLVWAYPSYRVFRYIVALTFGQLAAMVLVEMVGVQNFDLLLSDLLIILIIFLISYSVIYKIKFRYLGWLLFIAGTIHGVSFIHDIKVIDLQSIQRTQALFAFNLGMDSGIYLFALLMLYVVQTIQNKFKNHNWFSIGTAGVAIFLVLLVFNEHLITADTQILDLQTPKTISSYKSPSQSPGISARPVQRGVGMMTTPIMLYLSVEPFEVRQEILLKVSSVMDLLEKNKRNMSVIPVKMQEKIKQQIQDTVTSSTFCEVNNEYLLPADIITNFVTLSRGGVAIRETPIDEPIEDAILGITLIYDIESYPDSISNSWHLFPNKVDVIEASAVDPHGAFTINLSQDDYVVRWKSRIAGYKVPAIEAIEIEKRPIPVYSYIIWSVILLMVILQLVIKQQLYYRRWITIGILLAFILYPFIRVQINLPFVPQGKPSEERGSVIINDLLTNVYRAFDRRNEDDVYDRLALNVYDEQLTEIYLQNRQSMALENRGGARAIVDDVSIEKIHHIKNKGDGGYVTDVEWTVSGSVNHFGHTHYRQNEYRALISFGIDDDCWKINKIEILDAYRSF